MKKDYLSCLSRAVRWRLGAKEGAEVASDYRDLLAEDTRSYDELVRDFGKPKAVAAQLTTVKEYRAWLAVFVVLTGCLVLVGTSPLPGIYPTVYHHLFYNYILFEWCRPGLIVAFLGIIGAIVWFRWKGWKTEKRPKAVSVVLALLLVWLAAVLVYDWVWMHNSEDIWGIWGEMPSLLGPNRMVPRFTVLTGDALEWIGGLGTVIVGIAALIKARTGDRRWAAVYVLAMTAMLVSLESLSLLVWMDMDSIPIWENCLSGYFCAYAAIAAVGLVGTGAALC